MPTIRCYMCGKKIKAHVPTNISGIFFCSLVCLKKRNPEAAEKTMLTWIDRVTNKLRRRDASPDETGEEALKRFLR
jgi:hypothetical protein